MANSCRIQNGFLLAVAVWALVDNHTLVGQAAYLAIVQLGLSQVDVHPVVRLIPISVRVRLLGPRLVVQEHPHGQAVQVAQLPHGLALVVPVHPRMVGVQVLGQVVVARRRPGIVEAMRRPHGMLGQGHLRMVAVVKRRLRGKVVVDERLRMGHRMAMHRV